MLDEILLGDLYEGESTWLGTGGAVAIGFIPVLGQIADARDTIAAIGDVIDNPDSAGAWGGLGLAMVGWVPGLGDAVKGVKKGSKLVKEGLEEVTGRIAGRGNKKAFERGK